MDNNYVLFKGNVSFGVPYLSGYKGNPHYVIVLDNGSGQLFKLVTNVKSDSSLAGPDGYHLLYVWDQFFSHPACDELAKLPSGLHVNSFPRLDYCHDSKLVDLPRMRPVPVDQPGEDNDCNDVLNHMLQISDKSEQIDYEYHGKGYTDQRKGFRTQKNVTAYGFGFLFPANDGLHETHMNQGNPRSKRGSHIKDHSSENGVFQDGAVFVEVDGKFQAFFSAFQTQMIPTDHRGYPLKNARPILG